MPLVLRVLILPLVCSIWLFAETAGESFAQHPDEKLEVVPPEEYPIYDLVVRSKFLTSETTLVVIERVTVVKQDKEERPYLSRAFLDEQEVFQGKLPPPLVDDFLFKLRQPARLEARFNFGVRYRFILDGVLEEPEVSLAPIPVGLPFTGSEPTEEQSARPTIGTLRFSRVAFTPRENQALVYVEEERPDGTGGGFLVWLRRQGKVWKIMETDVLWIARPDGPEPESP